MNSKNLHKHALPIVIVAVAGVIASTGATTWLASTGGISPARLQAGLTTSLISLHPGDNGFASARVQSPAVPADSLGDSEAAIGATTALDFALLPQSN